MADKETQAVFSSKEMLKKLGKAETKFKYTDTKTVEIVKATKHYPVGKVFKTHKVKADALIEAKIAKEVK